MELASLVEDFLFYQPGMSGQGERDQGGGWQEENGHYQWESIRPLEETLSLSYLDDMTAYIDPTLLIDPTMFDTNVSPDLWTVEETPSLMTSIPSVQGSSPSMPSSPPTGSFQCDKCGKKCETQQKLR